MSRTREFDENTVLASIKNVFWQKGYQGASYSDLMRESGLGKGSLYAAFGDKKQLYHKALAAYVREEVLAAVQLLNGHSDPASPLSTPMSGRERIEIFLNFVVDAVEKSDDRRGCFLCNAAVDIAPYDKEIERATTAAINAMRQALKVALADVCEAGRRDGLAELILSTYFGMRVMAKAGVEPEQLRLALNAAMKTL